MNAVEALAKRLAGLTSDQLDRLLSGVGGAAPAPSSPRISRALEAVPADQVDAVIRACREGLDAQAIAGVAVEEQEARRLQPLQRVAPNVAAAALTNSAYRGKPISHSLAVAVRYLEEVRKPALAAKNGHVDVEAIVSRAVAAAKAEAERAFSVVTEELASVRAELEAVKASKGA